MGWGDDLMWLGEASKVHEENPNVKISSDGKYSILWDNIPWIAERDGDIIVPEKPGGNRWYIQGWAPGRILLKPYKPIPAPYVVTDEERKTAQNILNDTNIGNKPFVLINPDSKNTTYANNRDWGFEKWIKLSGMLKEHINVLRVKPPSGTMVDVSGQVEYNKPLIDGITNLSTDIRTGFAIASLAKCVVTTDGALQHLAAALNIPAFIIYGGTISPSIVGYEGRNQVNYYVESEYSPCGMQVDCPHCRACMEAITVEMLYKDVSEFLKKTS